jgi:hypothetical protein
MTYYSIIFENVYAIYICIVTDLIKGLLGNRSVNTFQHTRHATIEEAVFCMWSVSRKNRGSCVFCVARAEPI